MPTIVRYICDSCQKEIIPGDRYNTGIFKLRISVDEETASSFVNSYNIRDGILCLACVERLNLKPGAPQAQNKSIGELLLELIKTEATEAAIEATRNPPCSSN